MRRTSLTVLAAVLIAACGGAASSTSASKPSPVATRDPGDELCPDGKPEQAGLHDFGAYIGTWQGSHQPDPQSFSDYIAPSVQGRIGIRCSTDDFVVVEAIYLSSATPAAQAVQIAVGELPADVKQVYDHVHGRCRALQYQSATLARQLGPDDNDGRVSVILVGDASTYDPSAVTLVYMDLLDQLGKDRRAC